MFPFRLPFAFLFPLMLAGLLGCETESRVEPEPAYYDEDMLNRVKYDSLPPHTKRLLELMKNGQLAGASASDLSADLKKADEIERKEKVTFYTFHVDTVDYENKPWNPVLAISVQNKYGHIIRCGLITPELLG